MDYKTLYGKTVIELRTIARQYGVKLPAGINKEGIIEKLLAAYQKVLDEREADDAAQAQSQVSDLTNELLRKNAEKLHMASVETAKESERGIVDMETLQKTNADLIQTLDDVMKIQKEGREKRQAAEAEMVRMENDLKAKLLEIQH